MKKHLPVIFGAALFSAVMGAIHAHAEGSRDLHPASYPAGGARSALDQQGSQRYVARVRRAGFLYVYAEAGDYITLASSNRGSGNTSDGDILVYNPTDFGVPGDETLPASADFSCDNGSSVAGGSHVSGLGVGHIASRAAELAGPHRIDGVSTGTNTYQPCAYQVPATGIYGVVIEAASSGGGPNGAVSSLKRSSETVAGWDVGVRSSTSAPAALAGRVFTYAFVGYTGGNNRPVYSTLFYVTSDGYRYRQDLRGLDPNGYALYANTFGFLDNGQPLYKTIRGTNAQVNQLPPGVSAQSAEFPIFFSNIAPGQPAEAEAEKVLAALGIPLTPPSPQMTGIRFEGRTTGNNVTSAGVGGTFRFNTTGTVSYQVVISRDGIDFDPANPLNRVLTGIAYSGAHVVEWDGLDNSQLAFPARSEPYPFVASGRNGEVHFPIIDAENNGSSSVAGGGPTITRLNGDAPGDTTVFFDDRGYVTSAGTAVGELNGFLCGAATPASADPSVDLNGVDSSTQYRRWQNGGNSNSDCASSAGWGDAKAVNLWTYFLTPSHNADLTVVAYPVDLGVEVALPNVVASGEQVHGSVTYGNYGSDPALNVAFELTIEPGLGSVAFNNLPSGAAASYDNTTGVVTFTGMPDSLLSGQTLDTILFNFTAPGPGTVDASGAITTSAVDSVPENNSDSASTAIGGVDMVARVTGLPDTAEPGGMLTGWVEFFNAGNTDADTPHYAIQFGSGETIPASVSITGLPGGASVNYDASTGTAVLSGMPTLLASGSTLVLEFSMTVPEAEGGAMLIVAETGSNSFDAIPANNRASDSVPLVYGSGARIDIVAAAICDNDTPYLEYQITPVGFIPGNGATIEWLAGDSSALITLANQPLSGRLLWHEAAVDGSGSPVAWPGWRFVGGNWEQIPSEVRPAATVRFSVNPSATVNVSYPPATVACNTNPPGFGVEPPAPAPPPAPSPDTSAPPVQNTPPASIPGSAHAVPTLPLPVLMVMILAVLSCARCNLAKVTPKVTLK